MSVGASPEQQRSPIDATLLALIDTGGYRSASFQLEEVAGEWRYIFLVDEQVQCRVRCHGEKTERNMPFADVWRLAADTRIEDIAPTTPRPLLWQAAAREVCSENKRTGRNEPTLYVTVARDNTRGLPGLVYSKAFAVPERGTLGDRLTHALQTTRISGAAGRVRHVRQRISDDEARVATAAAVSTHLQGEGAWKDGGLPPFEFRIVEVDLSTQAQHILASVGNWDPLSPADSKRRSRLFDTVLNELEAEAFGSRGNADRTFAPLEEGDIRGTEDFTADVEAHLDLADLVAQADLSSREHEVFTLVTAGQKQSEIASTLGIAPGTVKATLAHARAKLKAEALKNFREYRATA